MRRHEAAFTLVELVVVLLVVGLLLAAMSVPLSTQLQARRFDEARRQLEASADALLGFAAAHGRLPCPATEWSAGQEAFAPGGSALDGECATFHAGYLPAAALGLPGLDAQGLLRDPWETPRNHVRYAVSGVTVNGVTRPFTRLHGQRAATLAGLGDANHFLFVCASGELASGSGCGPAAAQLTRKAVFVLLSSGPNAASRSAQGDEARNLDGNGVFVAREASQVAEREFDDTVYWVALPLLAQRMLAAGRLP